MQRMVTAFNFVSTGQKRKTLLLFQEELIWLCISFKTEFTDCTLLYKPVSTKSGKQYTQKTVHSYTNQLVHNQVNNIHRRLYTLIQTSQYKIRYTIYIEDCTLLYIPVSTGTQYTYVQYRTVHSYTNQIVQNQVHNIHRRLQTLIQTSQYKIRYTICQLVSSCREGNIYFKISLNFL